MNEIIIPQLFLSAADFLVLLSFILGLYLIALNPRNLVNRLVGFFILGMAVTNLSVVLAFRAEDFQSAQLPHTLLAAFIPTIFPAVLIISLLVLRSDWFTGRRRWIIYGLLVLLSISIILTVFDSLFGTKLYYSGFLPTIYHGGVIPIQQLVTGWLAWPVILINIYIAPILTLLILAQIGFVDKSIPTSRRNLGRVLLVVQVLAVAAYFLLQFVFLPGVEILFVTSIYILLYAFLTFQQQISERRTQTGRLQPRLTVLTLIITLPTFIYIGLITTNQTEQSLIDNANARLSETSVSVASSLNQWLDLNTRALQNIAAQPGIVSMDPVQQKPILETLHNNYPYMSLISTTDPWGMNIARSDGEEPANYSDRLWFQLALRGRDVSYQISEDKTPSVPALVVSTPIRNANHEITGTVMFSTRLDELSKILPSFQVGNTGFAYIVDERGYLVSHPGLSSGEVKVNQFAFVAPVDYARRFGAGFVNYKDLAGISWFAHTLPLDNNWVIVVQQQAQELLQPVLFARQFAWLIIAAATGVLLTLTWATMRQAFQPFKSLTETARAIARGDLKRVAPVESEDEFGTLARSFNSMTAQLIELIDSLELRVEDRTHDLERRTAQLKAATEVGRAVSTIHNIDRLLSIVTRLISESFGFYHVGIFLMDESNEYAVLRAANSEGGQHMVARSHRLKVGEQGIVGYVTQRREPRISLNVGIDSAHYVNPDLPDTRSEMALPLIVGGKLIGALDVQSTTENAFNQQDVETLQVLADQVAIAISNANLVAQTQELLEAERRSYREITQLNWLEFTQSQKVLGYLRDKVGLQTLKPKGVEAQPPNETPALDPSDPQTLLIPISIRSEMIGLLRTRKPEYTGSWTQEEIRLVENLGVQLGVALESARAYQDTQLRATRERIVAEVGANIRKSLDLETILRTTTREVRRALGLPKVVVQLAPPEINVEGVQVSKTDKNGKSNGNGSVPDNPRNELKG